MPKIDCMERSGLYDEYIPMMNTEIQIIIDSMKSMADHLIPYSFPVVSFKAEEEILCLKQRIVKFDGYDAIVSYSKADYGENVLVETLQIQSPQVPFLPFNVVCKIGVLFFGKTDLSYVDFFKYNRKVYCWVVKSLDGNRLPPHKESKQTSFDGFNFYVLPPGSVDLL